MTDWRPRHDPWAIAMTVTLATFMEVLDTSIANVALPHIAGSLGATTDEATWILTSYLVSNAVVLPLSGWLASRIGRRRFYMSCVAMFTVSSLLCGFAPNLGTLIALRIVQGAGGGGLQPSEQAILADTFPQEKRGMAFAVYGMAVVLAPAIGPTLGGFITDNASWRWIFFINVPVGIASLLLTHRLVEDPPYARAHAGLRVDYVGIALLVTAFGALQLMLDKGERDDWFSSPLITAAALVSAAALIAAIVWELRHEEPIVDLRLFHCRNFAIGFVLMFVLGAVLFATTVLLPLYLQTVLGYTAQRAGMVLSPGGVVLIALLPLVGRLLGKLDARWLVGFGFAVSAASLAHMTLINSQLDFRTAVSFRTWQSAGLAFLFVPINTLAYVGVPFEKNNQISALTNLARNVGGGVGISLATTLIARGAQLHQTMLAAHTSRFDRPFRAALDGLSARFGLDGALARLAQLVGREATTLAYVDTLWLLALVCAGMLPLVLLLKPGRSGAVAH